MKRILLCAAFLSLAGLCFGQSNQNNYGRGYFTAAPYVPVRTGLMAEYRFDEGSGSTLRDRSNNGNDATFPGGGADPSWVTGGLSFAGSTAYVDLPARLNSAVTIMVFLTYPTPGINHTVPVWLGSTDVNGLNLLLYNSLLQVGQTGALLAGAFKTGATEFVNGDHAVAYVLGTNPTKDKIYFDGHESTAYVNQTWDAGTQIGNWRLGKSPFNGLGTLGLTATYRYLVFYNRALTAAEIAMNYRAMASIMSEQRGLVLNLTARSTGLFDNRILYAGDSITAGKNPATPYTSLVSYDDTYTQTNVGLSGLRASDLFGLAPFRDDVVRSYGVKQVYVTLTGTNELMNSVSGATAAASILSAACARHAAGWRVVLMTVPSMTGSDAGKNSINALLRSQWRNCADALADIAANALLGADGASTNLTYFQDGIHPTTAGNTIIAAIVSTAINSLYGSTPDLPNSSSGASYTILAKDVYLKVDPTSGSVTATLPTAVGYTGQYRYVRNVQRSGVNTVTVAAGAGEDIDGLASVAVPNNTVAGFVSVLTSATTGGAHWEQVKP